jgi:putative effector of murein hydrolase
MKIIFKILVSPFIFILTAIMYLFPLNVFSYFTAMFGFVGLFKHIFCSLMKWENNFDYPFFDHFNNPIHNYLAGATIHIWFPFYNTYLFLFNEEKFRYNELSVI